LDKEGLEKWLRQEGTGNALTEADLLEAAYTRLRTLQLELPSEKELRRLVNAALNSFFQDLYHRLSDRLSPTVKGKLDQLLVVAEGETFSGFEKLKTDPAAPGVDNLKKEVAKLQQLLAVPIADELFLDVPLQSSANPQAAGAP
jgi:hypothetical protein